MTQIGTHKMIFKPQPELIESDKRKKLLFTD